jgi:multiple sugar transport system permease protein
MAIILLAGMQGIPEDLYDAARVDGASAWQRFGR